MARIALLYGTTEGRTGIVAGRMAAVLEEAGHDPVLFHAGHLPADFSLAGYDAVVIGASVHVGSHQRYVSRFVSDHVDELNRLPSAFFGEPHGGGRVRGGVGNGALDARGVPPGAGRHRRRPRRPQVRSVRDARAVRDETHRQARGGTDTSRDYEYADWDEVASFADALD